MKKIKPFKTKLAVAWLVKGSDSRSECPCSRVSNYFSYDTESEQDAILEAALAKLGFIEGRKEGFGFHLFPAFPKGKRATMRKIVKGIEKKVVGFKGKADDRKTYDVQCYLSLVANVFIVENKGAVLELDVPQEN